MTQNEALNLLGINDASNSVEAIEMRLFELKKEIIAFCHVPQLLVSKQKKLKQLMLISETLKCASNECSETIVLNSNETEFILESFNAYHCNRSFVLQKIAVSDNCKFIMSGIDSLVENIRIWSEKWSNMNLKIDLEAKLSTELDSIQMLQIIKSLKNQNIQKFQDLREKQLPHNILLEIKRLNLIHQYLIGCNGDF
jgi:aryl carrier-like protein